MCTSAHSSPLRRRREIGEKGNVVCFGGKGKTFPLTLTDGRLRFFYELRRRLDAHNREGPEAEGGRVLITPRHGNHLGRVQMVHITSQHTPLKRRWNWDHTAERYFQKQHGRLALHRVTEKLILSGQHLARRRRRRLRSWRLCHPSASSSPPEDLGVQAKAADDVIDGSRKRCVETDVVKLMAVRLIGINIRSKCAYLMGERDGGKYHTQRRTCSCFPMHSNFRRKLKLNEYATNWSLGF